MIRTAETYHVPVLLKESIDGLNINPDGIYVDVTFGGGGHSMEILSRLSSKGRLFSFDQDADAEQNIRDIDGQQQGVGKFTFVRSNFRYLKNWMRYYGIEKIDGLLGDLGVSSHHFDDEERGFSFRFDAPLDMRMNKRAGKTAADILQDYDEGSLPICSICTESSKSRERLQQLLSTEERRSPSCQQPTFNPSSSRYSKKSARRRKWQSFSRPFE